MWTGTSKRLLLSAPFCWIIVLAFSPLNVFAQYQINSWTIETGLPQNSINSILQTRDGYLWLTTFDGLVRYDGVRFTVFNKNNSPGLCGNRLVYLLEDREGNLWISCETGGISRYRDGAFTAYMTENGLTELFHQDNDGNVLVATAEGIVVWKDGKFTTFTPSKTHALPSLTLQFSDRTGGFWYRDREKIYRLRNDSLTTYTTRDGLSSISLLAYFEDRDGNLWFGADGSLNKFRDGQVTVYGRKDGLPPFRVNHISQDHDGNLWIASGGGGLVRFKDGKFTAYTKAQGLSSDDVSFIYPDREAISG